MADSIGKKFYELTPTERDALPDLQPRRRKIAPPSAKLLKKTHSVCPRCSAVITADVCEEDDAIWMYKRCDEHGPFKGLVDSDVDFYKRVMNKAPIRRKPYDMFVIPVTHRCNLDCALCFVPKRDRDDLSLEQLKKIIDDFEGSWIGLSGGEPTLRDDLPDLLRHIRASGRTCQVLTNGIKFTDRSYLRQLVDAGLNDVLFSFNGFSDRFFQEINRKPLLDIKLEALQNCIEEGVQIALSPTIFRGLNEEDLVPLVGLCLDHAPSIYELRIRGACRVGRHETVAPLATSELLKAVAPALGSDAPGLMAGFDPASSYHSAIQFNIMGAFKVWNDEYELTDWGAGHFSIDKSLDDLACDFIAKVKKETSMRLSDEAILARYKFLSINVWGWPDSGNIDFQEIHSHGVYHLYNNARPMNFCEAVLAAESL